MKTNNEGTAAAEERGGMLSRRYVDQLPDVYYRAQDGNTHRLLGLAEERMDAAFGDVADTCLAASVEDAFGATLDLFGAMVGQRRGAMNDTKYRYLIRNRISRNFVVGDYESVMAGILNIFQSAGEENANGGHAFRNQIQMDDHPDKPGVVRLQRLPFATLMAAGFTANQAVEMIEQLLPVGVRLEAENFEGTFEFESAPEAVGVTLPTDAMQGGVVNGVTFTALPDGSLRIDGTAGADAGQYIFGGDGAAEVVLALEPGNYSMPALPEGMFYTFGRAQGVLLRGAAPVFAVERRLAATSLMVGVEAGATVDDAVWIPALRHTPFGAYDEGAGFADDPVNPTMGGYLGLAYNSEDEEEMPI